MRNISSFVLLVNLDVKACLLTIVYRFQNVKFEHFANMECKIVDVPGLDFLSSLVTSPRIWMITVSSLYSPANISRASQPTVSN